MVQGVESVVLIASQEVMLQSAMREMSLRT